MQVLPIDLTAVIATIMGISIVLVPVIGLTARFALKPLAESLGRLLQSRNAEESVRILERRMALLEQQIESMDGTLQRVAEAAEFHRDLRGPAPDSLSAPRPGPGTPPEGARS